MHHNKRKIAKRRHSGGSTGTNANQQDPAGTVRLPYWRQIFAWVFSDSAYLYSKRRCSGHGQSIRRRSTVPRPITWILCVLDGDYGAPCLEKSV